jgi:Methyl-accepting chemotaxis protein-like, first PDC sensor domain
MKFLEIGRKVLTAGPTTSERGHVKGGAPAEVKTRRVRRLLLAWTVACVVAPWNAPAWAVDAEAPAKSLVRLAADRIDVVFQAVAASTRAVGEEYRMVAMRRPLVDQRRREAWVARATTQGQTTGFRTWPKDQPAPAFQAAYPGLYSYRGNTVTAQTVTQLENLERTLPVIRAAYRSFDFSWTYLTTVDDMMLIYPYVPLDQAVNNAMPTRQVFYTAADFARRTVGWTAPYLDLVGAGMMITASYPIYSGDRLLGVASHDVTLKQLSSSVLSHLASRDTARAFIVDQRGMAVAASDPALAAELERVNGEKKAAVLFYRSANGLAKQPDRGAIASRHEWVNEVVEHVLAEADKSADARVTEITVGGRNALAARIASTGWFVILVTTLS